ncbi:MAG: hypothetical protein E7277_08055 [Lachnospiraceae bacterium]|nr:hypothetical protein [Lachnospiraceae bacterium]
MKKKLLILTPIAALAILALLYFHYVFPTHDQKPNKNFTYDNIKTTFKKQTIAVDDYRFTMEKLIYDKKSRAGYCVLSLAKKNGRMEGTIDSSGEALSLGKNERFVVRCLNAKKHFVRKSDKIYAYLSFTDVSASEDYVHIEDTTVIDPDTGYCVFYSFKLYDTVKPKHFVADYCDVYINPVGGCIVGSINDSKVTFYSKKKKLYYFDEIKRINDKHIHNTSTTTSWVKLFLFNKKFDFEKIDHVTIKASKKIS